MNPRRSALHDRPSRGGRRALRAVVTAALVAAAVGLAGCTPGPAPKPTPTPLFTSEADAFKAAEQVYRDYVDATNDRNDGDKDAAPEAYMAGRALQDSLKATEARKAAGISLTGHFQVVDFQGGSSDLASGAVTIVANVCVDVSGTKLIDGAGADVTPTERAKRVPIEVQFNEAKSGLKIYRAEASAKPC